MKKIVVTDEVMTIIAKEKTFLDRNIIKLFMVASNDDVLPIHRAERADIIITTLHMPGMKIEELCSAIRADEALRRVSIIILSPDNAVDLERGAQCKANLVVKLPVTPAQLLEKVQTLMDISWRESYRVLVSVIFQGTENGRAFFGRSDNLSSTGMLIETEKELKKGDHVTCSFFLPGSSQIKVEGEIVRVVKQVTHSKARQYGVRFISLAEVAKSAVDSFIEKKSQVSTSRK